MYCENVKKLNVTKTVKNVCSFKSLNKNEKQVFTTVPQELINHSRRVTQVVLV